MSYLPNNPYAPTTPMLPPQLGLGGPAPMNPMAPMPQPGIPAGLGQDAFASAAAAGAPAAPNNQQGSVFQHPSGGLADVNQSLSGGNYWSSWKGITAIASGVAILGYIGISIAKGQWNPMKWGAGSEYGTKALHELTGDLKTAADGLVEKVKDAKAAFLKDLTKENADTRVADFKKVFSELKDKNLKSEVTEADYKVFTDLESAHSAHVDKIAEGVKADKPLADVLSSEEVTKLEEAIQPAEEAFSKKLKASEPDAPATGPAQPATGSAQPATGSAQPATGPAQPATGPEKKGWFPWGRSSAKAGEETKATK